MRKHSNTDDATQPALRLDGALIESGGRLDGSHHHQREKTLMGNKEKKSS